MVSGIKNDCKGTKNSSNTQVLLNLFYIFNKNKRILLNYLHI